MPQLIYNGRFDIKNMPFSDEALMEYCIERKSPEKMILIVPTERMAKKLPKDFISKYFRKHKQPCQKPRIYTLQKFAQMCYQRVFGSEAGRNISDAFLYSLMEEAMKKSDLKFFANESQNISYSLIKKISDTILGIKKDGIMPKDLYKDLEHYVPQKRIDTNEGGVKDPLRLEDIAKIYENYQKLLGSEFLDSPQIFINLKQKMLSTVSDDANSQESQLFPSGSVDENLPIDKAIDGEPIILLHGFSEFKVPEIEFLAYFAKSKFPFAINLDYTEFNGPLFGNLRAVTELLIKQGFNNRTVLEDTNFAEPNSKDDVNLLPSQYLRRWLFNTEKEIRNESFESCVKIIEAENIVDEVRSIAKLVRYKIKDCKVQQQDICVCMRTPSQYTSLFREMFALYKIPCFVSDRYNLSNSQLVTAILSIFDVVIDGYRKADVFKMIQSSYIKHWGDNDIDVPNLVSVAKKLRIIGGTRRRGQAAWEDILKARIDFLKSSLEQSKSYEEDDAALAAMEASLKSLDKALNDFNKITDAITFSNEELKPNEISQLIKVEVLEKFKIKETITSQYADIKKSHGNLGNIEYYRLAEEIEKDVAALNKFIDLVDEMAAINSERIPNSKIKLGEFIRKLKIVVANEKYQLKERSDRGVKITSIDQIRGIPFKVLILCGAVDGEFPLNYRVESMLGKILPKSESRHKEAEKIAFYQFLTNNPKMLDKAEQEIYISYPQFGARGEIVMSSFIQSLYKVSTLNLSEAPHKGYYPKVYNLAAIRNAIRRQEKNELLEAQISDIPWLSVMTEQSEILKSYSKGLLARDSIKESGIVENAKYIDTIEKYIESVRNKENLEKAKLSEPAKEFLQNYRNRAFSISEIESYADCPYRYFAQRILRIAEREKETTEITPIEKGSLLHAIVYKFYSKLQGELPKSEKPPIVKLDANRDDEYKKLLLEIAEQELEAIKFSHPYYEFEKKSILGDGDTHKGILQRWLISELDRISDPQNEFYPALFEYSFGEGYGKPKNSSSEAVTICDEIKVKGKIDRLEFDKNYGYFKVADYKTRGTSLPSIKDVKEGKKFQIPIYLAAASVFLEKKFAIKEILPAGGIYYFFVAEAEKGKVARHKHFLAAEELLPDKDKAKKKSENLIENVDELKETVNKSLEYFKNHVEAIIDGTFQKKLKPDRICEMCDYYSLCRLSDSRTILQEKSEETNEEN